MDSPGKETNHQRHVAYRGLHANGSTVAFVIIRGPRPDRQRVSSGDRTRRIRAQVEHRKCMTERFLNVLVTYLENTLIL